LQTRIFLRVKHGAIIASHISVSPDSESAQIQANHVHETLKDRRLHEISMLDWTAALCPLGTAEDDPVIKEVAEFIGTKLGVGVLGT
jgi:lipoate-protein ligase A